MNNIGACAKQALVTPYGHAHAHAMQTAQGGTLSGTSPGRFPDALSPMYGHVHRQINAVVIVCCLISESRRDYAIKTCPTVCVDLTWPRLAAALNQGYSVQSVRWFSDILYRLLMVFVSANLVTMK